ncbi:hypothetical protein H2508_06100 [Parahaliea sp. F7430]|uniref:Uncharacterized protein n=1 Tax=Sediminihaliea albiluteola TaxID=2758564 RepID=A0A7W2TVH0_9GAMM|nr:hypothetical protein [Sediminihaliea albiluteola]MBA6412682.1 hypothetical protein [Sediminihaliea albiluteola]
MISKSDVARWRRRSAFKPAPVPVTYFILGWATLSLSLAPFLHFPLLGALPYLLAVLYLAILYFLPRAWLYVLPLATVLLDFSTITGRPLFNLYDLVFLLTISGGLMFNRYKIGVLAPSTAIVAIEIYLLVVLLSVGLWHNLLSPPGALLSPALESQDYGYTVLKALIWGILLLPMYGHAIQRNKIKTTRDLVLGMLAAALAICLLVGWEHLALAGTLGGKDVVDNYHPSAYLSDTGVHAATLNTLCLLFAPFLLYAINHFKVRVKLLAGIALIGLILVLISTQLYVSLWALCVLSLLYFSLEYYLLIRKNNTNSLVKHKKWAALSIALSLFAFAVLGEQGLKLLEEGTEAKQYGESKLIRWLIGDLAGKDRQEQQRGMEDIRITDGSNGSLLMLSPSPSPRPKLLLGQKIQLKYTHDYSLIVRARSNGPASLDIRICETTTTLSPKLLAQCAKTSLAYEAPYGEFRKLKVELELPQKARGNLRPHLPIVLLLHNPSPEATIEVDSIAVSHSEINKVRNSSFSNGLDHWLHYYSKDRAASDNTANLFVNLAQQSGMLAVLLLAYLVAQLLINSLNEHDRDSLLPVYIAAVSGVCLLGFSTNSLLSPRAAWLFYFLLFAGLTQLKAKTQVER